MAEPFEVNGHKKPSMGHLSEQLDQAGVALARSVRRVRGDQLDNGSASVGVKGSLPIERSGVRVKILRRGKQGAREQSMAALQAVVWIASFVQSMLNAAIGRDDEL